MASVIHLCGAEIPDTSFLCPECGSPVRDGAGMVVGPEVESTQTLPGGAPVPTSEPARGVSEPTTVGLVDEATRPCPTVWCGGMLRPEDKVCPYCSAEVPPVHAVPPLHVAPSAAGARPTLTVVPNSEPAAPAGVVSLRLRFPQGQVVELSRGEAVELGRESPDPAIAQALLPLGAVSRRHARLEWSGERITVTDLNSTNGTFVDGAEARPTLTRPAGPMAIRLGKTVIVHIEPGE